MGVFDKATKRVKTLEALKKLRDDIIALGPVPTDRGGDKENDKLVDYAVNYFRLFQNDELYNLKTEWLPKTKKEEIEALLKLFPFAFSDNMDEKSRLRSIWDAISRFQDEFRSDRNPEQKNRKQKISELKSYLEEMENKKRMLCQIIDTMLQQNKLNAVQKIIGKIKLGER